MFSFLCTSIIGNRLNGHFGWITWFVYNIKGQFTYKNGNRGVIESISKSFQNQLSKGDTLFTSFSSNIYAEGIPVAKIISIKNNPIKHELDITVEVLADLNRLRTVFIVID